LIKALDQFGVNFLPFGGKFGVETLHSIFGDVADQESSRSCNTPLAGRKRNISPVMNLYSDPQDKLANSIHLFYCTPTVNTDQTVFLTVR
jgi:hypothetical protein